MFQRWTKVSFQLLTAVVLFLPLTMERVPENTHNFTRSGRSCCWKTGISWKDNTSIWMIWNSIDYINYVCICIYIYTHYFMHWKFKIIANLFSQIWFQLIFISESKLHCSQVGSPCIKPETRVRNVPKVLWLQISYRSLQRQENHGIGKHITLGSHEKHEALRLCGYPWNLDRLTIWHPSDIRLTLPGVSSNRSGSRGGDRNKSRHQHLQPRWPFENYECAGNWKRFCGKRGKCGDWKPIFRKT